MDDQNLNENVFEILYITKFTVFFKYNYCEYLRKCPCKKCFEILYNDCIG